jgi:hypothetical protein
MAAVAMGDQALEAALLIEAEPGVERVGVAGLEQARAGHGVGRLAGGDLEQSGAAFTDVGTRVVIAVVKQLALLRVGQTEGATLAHGRFLQSMARPLCHSTPVTDLPCQNSLGGTTNQDPPP